VTDYGCSPSYIAISGFSTRIAVVILRSDVLASMQSIPEPSDPKRPLWYAMITGITHTLPKVLLLSTPFMLILLLLSFFTIQELRQDIKKLNHQYHLLQKVKQQSHPKTNLKVHTSLPTSDSTLD
jgi:hypothetical protein